MGLPEIRSATEDELYDLRVFEGSLDEIELRIRDNQDIVCNWSLLCVEPHGEQQRAVLIERSSLAVAWIVGDGARFGKVVAPPAEEVEALVRRRGLHWA